MTPLNTNPRPLRFVFASNIVEYNQFVANQGWNPVTARFVSDVTTLQGFINPTNALDYEWHMAPFFKKRNGWIKLLDYVQHVNGVPYDRIVVHPLPTTPIPENKTTNNYPSNHA